MNYTDVLISFRTNHWETLNELSHKCGEREVEGNSHVSRESLITPSQLAAMKTGQALVMISGHIKFITWLPDFTEMFDCSKWKAPKRTIRKAGKQVEVFNIKEYVQEVKKKKMRELMGEDQSSSLEHPSPSLPVTPRGSMTGSDPKKDKQDEETGFDVDSLIAKIDAKIAALEAEEAAEKAKAEKVAKNWEVILLAAGESKLAVIKAIREHTKMGLKQAKDIVDHLPHTFTFRSEKKAEQVVNAISDAGGIAISGIADGDEDDDE